MRRQHSPTPPGKGRAAGRGLLLVPVLVLAAALLALPGCSARVVRPVAPVPSDPTAERSFGLPGDRREGLVQTAREQIGTPYVYGGNNPQAGFDCSGLVYWVYRKNGVNVPRASWEQFQAGRPVPREDLRPGDLVFFKLRSKGQSLHSGIYSGDEAFIHSPKPGSRVREEDLEAGHWRGSFIGARRVVEE